MSSLGAHTILCCCFFYVFFFFFLLLLLLFFCFFGAQAHFISDYSVTVHIVVNKKYVQYESMSTYLVLRDNRSCTDSDRNALTNV